MSQQIALSAFNLFLNNLLLKGEQRQYWKRNLCLGGIAVGINLFDRLQLEDDMGFRNYLSLNSTDFEILLQMVGGKISKNQTVFRDTIPAPIRLAVKLRFLATGESFTSFMYTFRISKQAISSIVPAPNSLRAPNYFPKRIWKGMI